MLPSMAIGTVSATENILCLWNKGYVCHSCRSSWDFSREDGSSERSSLRDAQERGLAEEFAEALSRSVDENSYCSRNVGIVLQGATSSNRIGVGDKSTVRAFNIYHVVITHPVLIAQIMENSVTVSDGAILEIARERAVRNGKKGKATGLAALPLSETVQAFEAAGVAGKWPAVQVRGNTVSDNTAATLCEELTDIGRAV